MKNCRSSFLSAISSGSDHQTRLDEAQLFGVAPIRRRPIASIHRVADKASLLGNPYAALRILMRKDRGSAPFEGPIGMVGNTTCSGLG